MGISEVFVFAKIYKINYIHCTYFMLRIWFSTSKGFICDVSKIDCAMFLSLIWGSDPVGIL
jgi:hypothetical protein